jgi:hypothetical protein
MKRIILGACAIVVLAGLAVAQTTESNPPPPPPGEQMDNPDGPGPGWRHHKRHGGMDMMMKGKGFGIMVGKGHGLHVNCGQEPMKDCIAAAQPLIDAFNKAEATAPKAQ